MSSVDNRIVKMQLENSQFTSAANSTMNTLKKLTDSLRLSEGIKGLENVAKKAKDVDMSGLETGVETIKNKFSAMEIIGVTALVNVANSAVNAGKRLLSALTLDPVTSGFEEYETKMGAITTILTNTEHAGTKLKDVTAVLDELNLYADQTIYNFAEMTRNIGTFTAAGVDLETSANAIKGIANLAAGSGSTSQQASTAMYQLSQALAAGSLKLQDWNSVVNAGMGGRLFQNALEETAVKLGQGRDMSVSFRDSLQDGWITTEVLTETLKKFAEDESLLKAATQVKTYTQLIDTMKESVQSGWGQSWELILGDREKAAELFTAISDGFNSIAEPMANYRNTALKFWNEAGGREAVIKGLANVMQTIGNLLGPIYKSFIKIIDPWNGERLVSLSKGFERITEKLKITDKTGALVGKTFDGIFSVFKLVGMVLKPIGSLFEGLVGGGTPLIDVFFRMTSFMTGWITKSVEFIDSSGAVEKAIHWMNAAGQTLSKTFDLVLVNSKRWVTEGLNYAKTYISELVVVMGDMINAGAVKVDEIKQFVYEFNEAYKPLTKAKDFVVGVFEGIQNGIQGFLNFTKQAINDIKSFFDSIVQRVKDSNIEAIDFVNAGLFASLLLIIKKLIPFLKNFFSAVGNFKDSAIGVLDELQGVLESYQKSIKADVIKKIAIAIGILAASIWVLSKVEPDRLIPAVAALGTLMAGIMAAMWAFNKIDPKEFAKSASSITALIGISIALNVLASAMVKLSGLQWDEILRSVVGLAAACVAMFALVKTMNGANINPAQGVAIVIMASALYVLAGAMALLGNLKTDTIMRSLTVMGVVLGGLSLFFKSTKGIENSIKIALSLVPLTTSLLLLAGVLAIFGNMQVSTLQQGFIVLALALAELSAFTNSMRGFSGNMLSIGAGLLLLSGALTVLTGVIGILGNMDIHTLTQGLSAMAVALLTLSVALNIIPKDTIAMSTGILILSGALLLLSAAMKSFGEMSWESIGKSLVIVVGVLIAFAGASLLLAPAIPIMTAMALGLAALGLAAGVVGGSLALLSVGITMLSGAVVGAGLSIVTALTSVSAAIPIMSAAIALGLVSFLTVLGYNAVAIQRALTQLLSALLNTIMANIPIFIQVIVTFLSELMTAITVLTPQLVDTVVKVVTSVIEALTTNLPILAGMIVDFVVNLTLTVLTKMADAIPKVAKTITDIMVAILNAIGTNVPRVVNAMYDMIIKMINGLADAVETKMPQVRAAIKRLTIAIINEFKGVIKDAVDVGGYIVDGLKEGILSKVQSIVDAAKTIATSAIDAAKDFLGIHSPSRAFEALGMYSDQGLANGLYKYSNLVEDEAIGVADGALSGMRKAMDAVTDIINGDMDNQPVIRPVMDLTNIQNGAGQIGSLVNGNYAIQTSVNAANRVSNGMLSRNNSSDVSKTSDTTNNTNNSIINTFNITGDDPRAIADEVSKIIQKQVERRNVVWA